MNIVDQRTEAKKERVPVVPGGVYVQGESAMLLVTESKRVGMCDYIDLLYFVSLTNGERLTDSYSSVGIDNVILNTPDSNITYIPDATLVLKGAR
jgi:hypothetical protein